MRVFRMGKINEARSAFEEPPLDHALWSSVRSNDFGVEQRDKGVSEDAVFQDVAYFTVDT